MGCHHRHFCAAVHCSSRQGITHFSTGVIRDKTHRVNGFSGGTCGDQHLFAHQILLAGDLLHHGFEQYGLLRHSAVTDIAVGQHSRGRSDDLIAEML